MGKIKLTESQLLNVVKRVLKEYSEFGDNNTTKKPLKESKEEQAKLSLGQLKEIYPQIEFTFNPNKKYGDNAYFARMDIKTQDGDLEYLGALKGPVSKEDALDFFNRTASAEYDKYY